MRNGIRRCRRWSGGARKMHVLLAMVLVVLLTESCYKDRFGLDKISGGEWEPTLAAPIVNSRLTMADIEDMAGGIWAEDPSGLVSLIYRDTVLSDITTRFVNIPDQQSSGTFPIILPPTMLPGDSTSQWFDHTQTMVFPNGLDIDSILFKRGFIDIDYTITLNHDCRIEFVIENMKEFGPSGQTFRKVVYSPYDGNPSRVVTVSYPVMDFALGLKDDGSGGKYFSQKMLLSVTMTNNPNNSPYQIQIDENVHDLDYFSVIGDFGPVQLGIDNSTIKIDLFKDNLIGQTYLESPILRLYADNSFGVDFDFVFDDLYVTREATRLDIQSAQLPALPLPGVPLAQMGNFVRSTYVFDNTNSNIVDAINLGPYELTMDAHMQANPAWTTLSENFVNDTNTVNVYAELEVPLHGRAMDFTISDTSDFDLDHIDEIKTLELRVNTANMFPVEGILQLYFADSNGVVLDSAFAEGEEMVLNAASVSPAPELKTTTPAKQTAVVTLDEARLDNLFRMEKIIVSVRISTLNGGNDLIKVYNDNYVDIVLSSKADLFVEF